MKTPRLQRLLEIALACSLTVAVTAVLARAESPKHLERGLALVDEITAAQKNGVFTGDVGGTTVFLNRYGGSWNSATDASFIRFFDATNGTYAANYTTCSPLVTHLLKSTYGWDWKQVAIPDPLNNNTPVSPASPKSYLYGTAIKQQIGFATHVTSLFDVLPGDIAARWETPGDEGHTMIVVSVNFDSPKTYPSTPTDTNWVPALGGAKYYEVTVLDSSASGHSNDTRYITYNGKTGLSGGAGTGVIGVFVNAAGEVLAHTWSLPTSAYLGVKSNGTPYVTSGWLSGIKSRLRTQVGDAELVFGRLPALTPLPGVP